MKDGIIRRSSRVRLVRDGVIIHAGRLASLKHLKDDVREVREGFECGIKIEGYDDIKVGDIIEAFEIEKVARELSSTNR
jgi:translation initiation factor IF-2